MLIGVPINFPQALPAFLIAYNPQLYKINKEEQLKAAN
jgi:hypothetical protein